ncbi:predicted protein, partial [Nematostella vectensis]
DMAKDTSNYVLLYSLYSYPNVILCFFGGFLLDRVFGVRLGTLIFSAFVLAGQVSVEQRLWLRKSSQIKHRANRNAINILLKTLCISLTKATTFHFHILVENSEELSDHTLKQAKAYFLRGRIGILLSTDSKVITHYINRSKQSLVCLFSFICGICVGVLDKRSARILQKDEGKTGEMIQLRDVKDFPLSLWLIFLICVAYYVAVFPFVGLGLAFFQEKFDLTPDTAGAVNSIVFIISAAASPVLGFMVDRTGKNVFWVLLAVVLTLVAHGMVAFTFWNPFVAMSVLGVAYSLLACALWPLVSLVVPGHQLGTAYGFMQSIQNLGLAVITQVAGIIVDNNGYLILEIFF